MEEGESKTTKKKKVLDMVAKEEKKGVCYLSRIPPHMKPHKLRHLLSQYGEVSKIYLVPEDPAARKRRKQAGGNSGKNFTEGWVEFTKKSDAKHTAKLLNGEPMGGKRRSSYYYDLWNMKYLTKFKWNHLTEEIAYRKAVHEQKLAAEISVAKKERDFYLARVEQSKVLKAIEEKKRKKQQIDHNGENVQNEPVEKKQKVLRKFNQNKAVANSEKTGGLSKEVLAGVFARKADEADDIKMLN